MKIVTATKIASADFWRSFKSVFFSLGDTVGGLWRSVMASWAQVSYATLSKRAYSNPVSARALTLVAQLMAAVPLTVKDDEGAMEPDHDLVRLFDRPNPRMSKHAFFQQIVTDVYCGEVFIRRVAPETGPNAGKPTANGGGLFLLNPGRFLEFVRDQRTDEITGYRFSNRAGRAETYAAEDVLHIRRIPDPSNEDRAVPLLLGASRAMEQMAAADDWNKSLYEGGGRIPGYFIPRAIDGKNVQHTKETVDAAQAHLDQREREQGRKGTSMVMSGTYDYQPASMTLKDADFLEANRQNMRYIAAVIGVPPTLLGDEKGGSLTDAGVDSEIRATYMNTVLPLLDFILGELNAWLSPLYGVKLAYDRDQIDALNEDVNKLYERLEKACGGPFLRPNEAREATNYDRIEPTDEGYDPSYDQIRGKSPGAPSNAPAEREDRPALPNAGGDGAVVAARSLSVDVGGVRAAIRARFNGVN